MHAHKNIVTSNYFQTSYSTTVDSLCSSVNINFNFYIGKSSIVTQPTPTLRPVTSKSTPRPALVENSNATVAYAKPTSIHPIIGEQLEQYTNY